MNRRLWAGALSFLLMASPAQALLVHTGYRSFQTHKVVTIVGEITPSTAESVAIQVRATADLEGPTVVVIDSPGGSVSAGQQIIETLHRGHSRLVCVVTGMAVSMAWNILNTCDQRLAAPTARFLFHHIAIGGADERLTAEALKRYLAAFEQLDRQFDSLTARVLHMSMDEVRKDAIEQKWWSVQELIARGYLEVGTID